MTHKQAASPKPTPKLQARVTVPMTSPPRIEPSDPAESGTVPSNPFPIVGIGASAGGLAAFEAFFSGIPVTVDPGMAFVLVQHLAPDHESILTDLIRRYTRMEVFEVEDGMVVRPNCAYIIPPGRDMAFLNGSLQLLEPSAPRGQRLPIDYFFRSLAQDQRERAIGIVLSGTGSDGTLGVRAIKGEGGMVMAQNPESTEFDGMPSSAIATGLVDYELPPAEMATQLMAYMAHAFNKPTSKQKIASLPQHENALKKIFILLRSKTGHDFSHYKPSTIHRRIERRLAIHQIDTIESYVTYLQNTPAEVEGLFRDLLIGVTHFFRDTEAFLALEEKILPKLFADRPPGTLIRVWTPGCSTGEEAYSIAILLQERMEALRQGFTLQVFATDIDSLAIATARTGVYPASIATDLSPERLARFFVAEPGGSAYRIHKGIRDMLVFSEQNVIKDPPFSKIDLISCRNLLIYLGAELQKKLIPLFHYALNPGGILFLGTSETVGGFDHLFAVLDRKLKLYQRQEDFSAAQRETPGRFLPPMTSLVATPPRGAGKRVFPAKLPLRDLTEQALLQKVTPAGALVNGQGDILYLHGRTGMYLEPATGEVGVYNILKMAREGLRQELARALHLAAEGREPVRCPNLRVKTNGHFSMVNLSIHAIASTAAAPLEASLYLVVLEEGLPSEGAGPSESSESSGTRGPSTDVDVRIEALKQELWAKEEFLQTANEELKSSNEEMQSVNEELQSTNEELETSKEELQSVNEELSTINGEMQTKVIDLSRANNDMNNLLAGTGIGTVFLDRQLRILRFTPTASKLINLILSDVGRPIGHQVSNLVGYDRLVKDTQAVLDTLIPKEVDVETSDGKWYTMRIQPYRTLDDFIEGAVITFVDVTEKKKLDVTLKESEVRYHSVVSALTEGIVIQDRRGAILSWNHAAERILGLSGQQLQGLAGFARPGKAIHEDGTPFPVETHPGSVVLATGQPQSNNAMGISKPDGALTWLSINAMPIFDSGDPLPSAVVISFSDITERKQAEAALRKVDDLLRLASVVRDAQDAITVQDLDGRTLAWNAGAVRMYGWNETEALAMNIRERIPKGQQGDALAKLQQLSQAERLEPYLAQRLAKDGSIVDVSIISTALVKEDGELYAIATTERKIASKLG